ncbi:UNVERIFIED_CONTAM: hypothetical protein GTU68_009804 [Idotea baltica]|nr:hypothetical protein [Idotea baltica]
MSDGLAETVSFSRTFLSRTFCLAAIFITACSDDSTRAAGPDLVPQPAPEQVSPFSTVEALGESLFFDKNLSFNRSQSCAGCHDPERAFTDSRLDPNGLPPAFSLGDDGFSQVSRNVPTAAYASLTPNFQQPDYAGYIGGQFLDGRATDLESQAKGPPLGALEMGMPDEASVVARLQEDRKYVVSFESLYGDAVFDDIDTAYNAMAGSIAAFERTDFFSSFDSKYDKSLTGDYVYAPGSKAALGKALFFSQQFTNCATCHQLASNGSRGEVFTSFEYHNIGTPVNVEARLAGNISLDDLDEGLFGHPDVDDPAQIGKYRVPTLRNVAITSPYMNNGVFRKLDTVIRFYDKFLVGSDNLTNPETGAPWREPPFPNTVSLIELEDGRKLSESDIEGLICFLRTLTDERYESLIEKDDLSCD